MSKFPENQDLRTEIFDLNMGPQHPSTHGVLRLQLKLDGERVVSCSPMIGFLHRSLEKICENRTYAQLIPITDRLDYCTSMTSSLVYVMAVEKLLDLTIPTRAEYIRVIMSELNRIASHLIWYATFTLELGGTTPFVYAFRDREYFLDLFEAASGGRLLYNYLRIGGVARDLPAGFLDKMLKLLDSWEPLLSEEYEALLDKNPLFYKRTQGVGHLSQADALSYGVTGPNLRASGLNSDVRKVNPYSVYPELDFKAITSEGCDVWARYKVRMGEFRESAKILRQCAERIPSGAFLERQPLKLKVPAGETYVHIESPRGDLGCYLVSDGSEKPYRCKFRAPSFSHSHVLSHMIKDCLFSDIVAQGASVDIVLPETDR